MKSLSSELPHFIFLKAAVPVCAGLFVVAGLAFACPAWAGTFQFSPGDRQYAAALALAAEEEAKADLDVEKKIDNDEDFTPEDYGLTSVGTLPTSPFYFLKSARRGITSTFTFDPVKKAELNLQFAAEKILEAKTLSEREGTGKEEVVNAIENYHGELDRVKARIDNAAGRISEEKAEELGKKLVDFTAKYNKSLDKIAKDLPPETFEKISEVKENTAETFGKIFILVKTDKAPETIAEVLDAQKGSEFKQFKNLEILKEVGEKVPEQAKDGIRLAQENTLNRLHNELEHFDNAKQAVFEDFVKESGGNEVRHLEIINALESRPISNELRAVIGKAKEHSFSKTEDRIATLTPSAQEKLFEHLGEGNLEDLKVVKELENNIAKGILTAIAPAKRRAEENFIKKVDEVSKDPQRKDEFTRIIERSHDIKSVAVLDEIKALIPQDKQSFFDELKKKAVEEIKKDIDRTRNTEQRDVVFRALAGDHPEELEVIEKVSKEVGTAFKGVLDGLRNTQYSLIQNKAEQIQDRDRLGRLEEEFKKREDLFLQAPKGIIFTKDFFDERRKIFESPDRAVEKIEEAKRAIGDLEEIERLLPFDVGAEGGRVDPIIQEVARLHRLADRRLNTAETALGYNDVGRAYGEGTAAAQIARDGIRLAQDFKSGRKQVKEQPDFLPPEVQRPDDARQVSSKKYELYSPNEFLQYCFYVRGFLKGPLTCMLGDGRVFDVQGRPFPLTIPQEFIPVRLSVPVRPDVPRCPVFFSPSADFCHDGFVRYETDQNGCQLPPRCEQKRGEDHGARVHPTDKTICGTTAGYACQSGYTCEFPKPYYPDAQGKCISGERVTCQAFWQGFIFDRAKNACRLESTSGCSDPFVFHTVAECERANGIGKGQICPALATVDSCPVGQRKVVSYSSPECGIYYACEQEKAPVGVQYPYTFANGIIVKDYAGAKEVCLKYPPGSGGGIAAECEAKFGILYGTTPPPPSPINWIRHSWTFSDGITESSMILSRTDQEYLTFIKEVEAQCRIIPKSKFFWKTGAGNDSPDNWRNFGIPDCSGTGVATGPVCGNKVCEAGETITSCPVDCVKPVVVPWIPSGQCSDGIDNDRDGLIDYPADTGCYGKDDSDEAYTSTTGGCRAYTGEVSCRAASCTWYNHYDGTHCDDAAHGQGTGGGGGSTCNTYVSQSTCASVSSCQWNVPGSGSGLPYCSMVYAGDASSCPGFSYSRSDTLGKRYCQLNNFDSCEYNYPAYLNIANYSQADCPAGGSVYSGIPTSPSGLTYALDLKGNVVLTWNDNAAVEDSYKIERRAVWGVWTVIGSVGILYGGTGSYTDPVPPPGTYEYQVKACNSAGCSVPSNYVSVSRGTTTPPPPPTTQCSDGIDNDQDALIDYPSDTGCYGKDDNDETPGTGGGATAAPVAPSGLTYTLDASGTAKLTWTDNAANEDSHKIEYRSSPSGTWNQAGMTYVSGGTGTSFSYPVPSNSTYDFRVVACNSVGCSAPSNTVSVTRGTSTTSSCSSSLIALLGTDCHYMYVDSAGKSIYCDGPMTKSAKEGDTATTAGCSTATPTPTPPPSTPTVPAPGPSGLGHNYTVGATSVTFTWIDNSTTEDQNKVEERGADGVWYAKGVIGAVAGGTGTVNVPGNTSGTVEYRVRACNSVGCSAESNIVTIIYTSATPPPTPPPTTTTKCSDGIDNDGDGAIDYPADTGCYGKEDNDETYPTTTTPPPSTSSCSSSLIALLGDGCHYMYLDSTSKSIYCDGPMTKSAKEGDTATTAGCTMH